MLHFYKKKNNDIALQLIFGMSLIVFVACAILIGSYTLSSKKNQNSQKNITDQLDDLDVELVDGQLIDRYASLREQYKNIVGRLLIQNKSTVNDLIVMHTPDDPDYYLKRDADGNSSAAGTAYLDYECSVETMTDNYLIYAHAMKNLTQFGCLRHYKQKSYWEQYPTITFETMYDEPEKYEIFACFYSQRYTVGYEGFKYYKFKDASNKEEFDYYVDNVIKLSEYDTGIRPEYGEQLITLSTCDYTRVKKEGRFVVCARKKTGRLPKDNIAEETQIDEPEVNEEVVETTPSPTPTPTRAPTRTPTQEPTIEPIPEPAPEQPEIPTEDPNRTQEPTPPERVTPLPEEQYDEEDDGESGPGGNHARG